jgi:AraC-like DNA-binding protein
VHSSVEKARDYIEAYYFKDITLKELSDIACLSLFHLLRIFKQAIGVPPHVYLLHKRIEKAKRLLLKAENIASIAYETGFVDQSHLTNTFRSFVGVTPNQFRKTAIFYKN